MSDIDKEFRSLTHEEFRREQEERRKLVEEIKKECDIIYKNFLEEFEKLNKLDVYRPTILISHLYANFYLNQILRVISTFPFGMFSEDEKDYEFLERLDLFDKTNFLNMLIPSSEKDLKDNIIKKLHELNKNRNDIAHSFEVKTLRLDGKQLELTIENIRKINEDLKRFIKRLHELFCKSL